MSEETNLDELWNFVESLQVQLDDLDELLTYIQDHRNADTLGNRIFKLEEAVFGDDR
jgi:hypothetical protein